jgi:hypothetical protein
MRTKTTLGLMMAVGLMQALTAKADDVFVLTWRGTLYYTNDAGRIVAKSYTERDVINKIALNTGTSPSELVLVYRPTSLDTAVVLKSDPSQWSDYVQLPDPTPSAHTDVTATNGTQTIRQAFIFDEHHGTSGSGGRPIGSIFGVEKQRWSTDGSTLLSESFRGTFQFANTDPNDPVLPVGVFSGTFSTGRRIASP